METFLLTCNCISKAVKEGKLARIPACDKHPELFVKNLPLRLIPIDRFRESDLKFEGELEEGRLVGVLIGEARIPKGIKPVDKSDGFTYACKEWLVVRFEKGKCFRRDEEEIIRPTAHWSRRIALETYAQTKDERLARQMRRALRIYTKPRLYETEIDYKYVT